MISLMKISKWKLIVFSPIIVALLVGACGNITPAPIITETAVPSIPSSTPSITPSPIPLSLTPSPTNIHITPSEPAIAPNCKIANEDGQLYLLNDQEFRDLRTTDGKLDEALTTHYPEWANYTQMVPWSTQPVKLGEIIVSASLNEELNLQINPAVTLVTLGESLNWQLPANTDLFLKSREISLTLMQHDWDWTDPQNESLRSQYPEVANSGTYALYAFHNYDHEKLGQWCATYQRLFGTIP